MMDIRVGYHLWLLLLLSYCAVIYELSDQPVLPVPALFNMQDKVIHAMAYAVMAALFWQTARYRMPKLFPCAVVTVLFCSLYGISDEWHQSFVAGRMADPLDWLADTTGALLLTIVRYKREFVT